MYYIFDITYLIYASLSAIEDSSRMSDRVLVRTRFDPASEESVSIAVAEALALVGDRVDDLPPLAFVVDTDSLDALFSPQLGRTPPDTLRLSFPYETWEVTVVGTGEIIVSVAQGYELSTG